MEFLIATIGVPLVLGVLAAGVGFLLDRLGGGWVPLSLIVPLGFAGLIGVTQFTISTQFTAPATVFVAPLVAGFGLWIGRARLLEALRGLRGCPWPLLAGVGLFLMGIAPELLSGRVTLSAFLLDSTAGVQMAGAERLVTEGRDFASLPQSSYSLYLNAYFGNQYPSGSHGVLGLLGQLTRLDLLWLYQPYLSCALALNGPTLWWLLRRFDVPALIATVGAVVAGAPALVYSYALMGAIKEIVLLPVLLLLFAVVLHHDRWLGRRVAAVVPVAAVAAAGVGTIGLPFGAWLLVAVTVVAGVVVNGFWTARLAVRPLVGQAVTVVVVGALLALPTLTGLASSLTLASNLSQSNAAFANDPGNLLQPLNWFQVLGVWFSGSHRLNPPVHYVNTIAFAAVVGAAVVLGALRLVRERLWTVAAFVAGILLVWWGLTVRGTVWTDAKLIVISSPFVVMLAVVGAWGLARLAGRVEAVLLLATVAVGVLLSNAFTYHETNLAPTGRYQEQQRIADRFAGLGPALLTDFDEYALAELRDLQPTGPGLALKPLFASMYASGRPIVYGATVDVDELPPATIQRFPLLVLRRSPERSLPPTGYVRAWSGRFYEVWRRTPKAEDVVAHLGAQRPTRADGRIACRAGRQALDQAGEDARLVVSRRAPTVVVDPTKANRSGLWSANRAGGLGLIGQGQLDADVLMPSGGDYRLWLKGDFGRPFDVRIDGRSIGSVGGQTGGQGNYAADLDVRLSAGRHTLEVRRPGGSFAPADGQGSRLAAMVLEPAWEAAQPRRETISPGQWADVCRKPVDWLEVVR